MAFGFVAFVVCLVPPLRGLREVGFNPRALRPDWLSGYVLLAFGGVLLSLCGWDVARGSWWGAAGRLLIAALLAYAGTTLILIR